MKSVLREQGRESMQGARLKGNAAAAPATSAPGKPRSSLEFGGNDDEPPSTGRKLNVLVRYSQCGGRQCCSVAFILHIEILS